MVVQTESEVRRNFPNEKILLPKEFLKDFTARVKQAKPGEHIMVQAMTFDADPETLHLAQALCMAQIRGVNVSIYIDHFVKMVSNDVPNLFLKTFDRNNNWPKIIKKSTEEMYKAFKKSGVDLHFTNPPKLGENLEYCIGRNHRKMFIIDDVVYIGGINLSASIMNRYDFMLRTTDTDLIKILTTEFNSARETKIKKDEERVVNPDTSLLIDAGVGTSIILEKAMELITNATDQINIMTPRPLSRNLAKLLNSAAQRGVEVNHITNSYVARYYNLFSFVFYPKKLYYNSYIIPNYPRIHGRMFQVDDQVLFGSHTFDPRIVKLRTGELDILTSQNSIIEPLAKFFEASLLIAKKVTSPFEK